MTNSAIIGGLDTDIEAFKQFSRQAQRTGGDFINGTLSLIFPTVTGDKDFTVVVESDS